MILHSRATGSAPVAAVAAGLDRDTRNRGLKRAGGKTARRWWWYWWCRPWRGSGDVSRGGGPQNGPAEAAVIRQGGIAP